LTFAVTARQASLSAATHGLILPLTKLLLAALHICEDAIIDDAGRDALRAGLPAARVRIFEHLGSNLFREDSSAVAAVINDFLAVKR
jgi:hypothetical protein